MSKKSICQTTEFGDWPNTKIVLREHLDRLHTPYLYRDSDRSWPRHRRAIISRVKKESISGVYGLSALRGMASYELSVHESKINNLWLASAAKMECEANPAVHETNASKGKSVKKHNFTKATGDAIEYVKQAIYLATDCVVSSAFAGSYKRRLSADSARIVYDLTKSSSTDDRSKAILAELSSEVWNLTLNLDEAPKALLGESIAHAKITRKKSSASSLSSEESVLAFVAFFKAAESFGSELDTSIRKAAEKMSSGSDVSKGEVKRVRLLSKIVSCK